MNSASYTIACNLLHNMHRVMLFSQPHYQAKWETRPYALVTIWPTTDVLLEFIFFCANPFLKVVFRSMSRWCLQHVWYFSLSGIWWNSTCLLVHIWVVNKHFIHLKTHKSTNINMRFKMGRRIFACENSTHQLYIRLHRIYLTRKGEMCQWTWEQSRQFQFFSYIHCMTLIEKPLKRSIGFLLKYSSQFVPGFSVINIQITTDRRKPPKSR